MRTKPLQLLGGELAGYWRALHCLPCSCDADPTALSKYVVALLRKEKPKAALKELCIDQLEVFLAKGWFTLSFMSMYATYYMLFILSGMLVSVCRLFALLYVKVQYVYTSITNPQSKKKPSSSASSGKPTNG